MLISRQRRHSLFVQSLTGICLFAVSGCGLSTLARTEPDHVYSTASPGMLDAEEHSKPVPAEARYPEQAAIERLRPDFGAAADLFVRVSAQNDGGLADEASAEDEDGVVRLSELVPGRATVGATGVSAPRRPSRAIPAEPRLQLPQDGRPLQRMETSAPSPLAELYPDEYLFDGGDRNHTAGLHAEVPSGIETEDTLAGWVDSTGARRTQASNRVAIYSPRFGSVRSVSGLVADTKIDKAAGASESAGAGSLKIGKAPQQHIADVAMQRVDTRRRADGVKTLAPPVESVGTDRPMQSLKADSGQLSRASTAAHAFKRRQAFVLAEQRRNASAWTRNEFPVIYASTDSLTEVRAVFKVQETTGLEDQRRPGTLHVVKLADRDAAAPGDVLRFTIRYENTGDLELHEVRVVDNLTPRLEYLPGSAVFDDSHPGSVEEAPNGEGSSMLTFRLDQPLAGHSAGTITFQVRVR